MSDDAGGPLDVNEEWHTCLIAAQLHFQRALLRMLINKNVLNGEEARKRFLAGRGRERRIALHDSRKVDGESGIPRQQIVASWLESLARLGGFIIRISLPRLSVLMLSNPLKRVIFRNKAPDYFRFAIGPQNIDPPARSGIFPSHESWSLLEHPSNMRPRRPGSSQQSCHNQTDHRNSKGRSASAHERVPLRRQGERGTEARLGVAWFTFSQHDSW